MTINAMGMQANIARAIRDKKADYVLAVKNNQPTLAEAIRDFFTQFKHAPAAETPHRFCGSVEKDHGRSEHRRCFAFEQRNCLPNPAQWPDLKSFVVIESERILNGKTTCEQRCYITCLPPEAAHLAQAVCTGPSRTAYTGTWISPSPLIRCAPELAIPQ